MLNVSIKSMWLFAMSMHINFFKSKNIAMSLKCLLTWWVFLMSKSVLSCSQKLSLNLSSIVSRKTLTLEGKWLNSLFKSTLIMKNITSNNFYRTISIKLYSAFGKEFLQYLLTPDSYTKKQEEWVNLCLMIFGKWQSNNPMEMRKNSITITSSWWWAYLIPTLDLSIFLEFLIICKKLPTFS